MGMEFTNNNSKRVLLPLPLETDFSNMSDPSVVIDLSDNNWRSDNRHYSFTDFPLWKYFLEGSV